MAGSYKCICDYGFAGTNCELKFSLCKNTTCLNNELCQCTAGYSGTFCETFLDVCASNPCRNGGACFIDKPSNSHVKFAFNFPPINFPFLDSFICKCPMNFNGTTCQLPIDPCAGNRCVQGACVPISASLTYLCACSTGYRGVFCDQQISSCESNPFQYGTCRNTSATSYVYQCASGYTSTNCDQKINACTLSNPCRNGAKCYELSGLNYLCVCSTGFMGKLKRIFSIKFVY